MAEVYLSKSIGANGVNKFLAIKRILPQFADNKEFIDMFKEEAKIAVNLNHNNVVSIIDFKAAQNQLYLVMEFVQGQNLRQILQQKKKKGLTLSLDFIVYLIREVSAGLEHAHRCVDKGTGKSLNIIHRDMSPQNIMVSYDGEIKIVDFGIAKAEATGEATRIGTLKGKFSYMSPEQAEGLIIDQSSDIFSIGIILWELIADDRLFVANNEMNILKRIKECDVPELRRVNPTVPIELERIVKKTLMKDKSLRYQASSDLQKDLTRFLNKEYPDFTPSDFSTFMKFLFESEYLQAQERMVNYAKLDFGTQTETLESNFAPPQILNPMELPDDPPANLIPHFNPNSNIISNQNDKVPTSFTQANGKQDAVINNSQNDSTQLTQQPTAQHNKVQKGFNNDLSQNTEVKKPTPSLQPLRRPSITPSYQQSSGGIRYKASNSAPTSGIAKFLISILIFGFIVGSFYFVSPKKTKIKLNNSAYAILDYLKSKFIPGNLINHNNNNTNTASNFNEGELSDGSTAPSVKVLVKSIPGRARIYINNKIYLDSKDQIVTTPATIEVDGNTPFALTILADGFLPYTNRITATKDGQEIIANLTPIKFGYIDINVLNAGIDTIIYIDGLQQKDRPPISKVPVQAGKPIKIKAIHPFSGTTAEYTITVDADEKKTVDLILSDSGNDKAEIKK